MSSTFEPQEKLHSVSFHFPLASSSHASILQRTLQVDKERNPAQVTTTITPDEEGLNISIQTTTLRLLRMNVNSLFDSLDLIIRTIDAFGSPLPLVVGVPSAPAP
ncbi:transcription factor Pcc1-domain-containing protein [Mrakia frigida]|uniref:chromatin DNA-binding EKC/KEOPS complex subunit PCC1 n=1 Tax=Mrakia frigida TaxID=29902 RepID=UPI003FCC0D7A